MARTTLAKRTRAVNFRRPSPLVAKLREQLKAAGRRARAGGGSGNQTMRDVVAAGGAAALGKLEQMGTVPATIGPVDSALAIGAVGAFVVPRFVKGKTGKLIHDATIGALCVAAYRLGAGGSMLSGDVEDGDLAGGGWEPAE